MFLRQAERRGVGVQQAGVADELDAAANGGVDYRAMLRGALPQLARRDQQDFFGAGERSVQRGRLRVVGLTDDYTARGEVCGLAGLRTAATIPLAGTDLSRFSTTSRPSWPVAPVTTIMMFPLCLVRRERRIAP